MIYSFESRVRYSEIGENGCITLPGILDYFQDCTTFHSESIGQGVEVMKQRGKAWVLSAWQVVVERYPKLGEEIVISTFPYDFKGIMGTRNFILDTSAGERLAYANTFWTHINTLTQMPAKLQPEDTAGYETEPRLDMEYAPRKIKLPAQWQEEEPFLVQKHHLDTNHHVNNCQYIVMAEDYLPEDFGIYQMRAEYKKQALLHDKICPRVNRENDKVTVLLGADNGDVYAVVECSRMKRKQEEES